MRTHMAALVVVAATTVAGAQHAHDGASGGVGHRVAQRCQAEFEAVIAEGRGFGLACAADQEGYPGPLHVLELGHRLRLTSDQESRMRELLDGMFSRSRPASARLLAAERRLRALFAERAADEESVRRAEADDARVRSEVRSIHLLTHLKTRDLLTDEQRRLYHAARWGH